MKGFVKTVTAKNYGFIRDEGTGKDVFFHMSDFSGHWNDLVEDYNAKRIVKVEFDLMETEKGPRAKNVRLAEHPINTIV